MKLSTMRRARRWVVQELARMEQQADGCGRQAPRSKAIQLHAGRSDSRA